MPTYDYQCKACGHRFDELQSFSEPPLTKCPVCKKAKLERLFGGGGAIIFKGSGFYETDYRRAGDAKPAESSEGGKSEAATGDGGESSKGETKTEAAPATSAKTESSPTTPSSGKSEGGKTSSGGSAKKAK